MLGVLTSTVYRVVSIDPCLFRLGFLLRDFGMQFNATFPKAPGALPPSSTFPFRGIFPLPNWSDYFAASA